MAVNNPFMETSSNFASYTVTMIGITVFSDTIVIFSTLKHIFETCPTWLGQKNGFSDA